ncbi:MAG: family 20 glycosylhydrolase [Flavobacteriaceae bacterium]|nr:family 20 glycosylhydrolase [Flavobacteriaceae bacterium]
MKYKFYILLFFVLSQHLYSQHSIIPIPVSYTSTDAVFIFDNQISLEIETNDSQTKQYVAQFRNFLSEIGVSLSDKPTEKSISVSLYKNDISELGDEGYSLEVTKNNINLSANKAAGIFNGIQTLKQLFPVEKTDSIAIAGCNIKDYPRFKWRGLMLDVSRHFFSVEEVKAYINQMSAYKLNVLHWHLTDDQGWRIEIKALPKLTEIGAWRVERHGRFGKSRTVPKPNEKATYGGFYTQEQIKDIVRYAQDRNVTIVPEIDIPGHSMAALAAYPELSVKKEPKYVAPGTKFSEWYGNGKFKMLIENTLNPTDEKVYDFVDKVFTEVAQLFPGNYIHMGGDEAYHGYWEENPKVQKFMKKHKIKDTHELQSYFVKRVKKIINSKGKKMIGWDEILDGGLADGATVMSWRGMKGGIAAAKMKHEVVMSPTTFAYLDYMQGDETVENKIYSSLSLEKSYTFEPVPADIDPKYILGGQGNLWTEAIPTMPYAFYMTYPRAFALVESVWSPAANKNWKNFIQRTQVHFDRFDASNINICKAVLDPIVHVYKENDILMCELKNSIPNSEIYYSIDNTYPVQFGVKYSIPFQIPEGDIKLRTQTFVDGKSIGRELIIDRTILVKRVGKKPFSF